MITNKKEISLLIISLAISILFVEIGLRAFTTFPNHGWKNRMDHPVLGYTFNPAKLDDIDASGFRNPKDNAMAEIVAIGDSHTMGYNVDWNEAWPYQLGRKLGTSVYNYGLGGYGIFHYSHLAKMAIRHKPKFVLLGLYPSNDIQRTACQNISRNYYQKLLDSGDVMGRCPPMQEKVDLLALLEKNLAIASTLKYQFDQVRRGRNDKNYYFNIGGNLVKKNMVLKEKDMTDLLDNQIKLNYNASKNIFISIHRNLSANKIKFGIIIIPSKHIVVEQWALNNNVDIPDGFSVESEKKLIEKYVEFFQDKGIPFINAKPFVVRAFSKTVEMGEDFYPPDDSHSMVKGYESYSLAAEELIKNQLNLN